MKKSTYSEKFSILLAICDDDKGPELEDFLNQKGVGNGILFMGKGTSNSDIADIFGFGMSDRAIVASLVPESSQEKILKQVSDFLRIEKDAYGLAMLLEVSSATSSVLDLMGISYGDKM
ncbi:MAG: hypothetical protein IJW59_00625 [Clostridia bacterium]|nr:hypothetical protein [Clostridia bacterium]